MKTSFLCFVLLFSNCVFESPSHVLPSSTHYMLTYIVDVEVFTSSCHMLALLEEVFPVTPPLAVRVARVSMRVYPWRSFGSTPLPAFCSSRVRVSMRGQSCSYSNVAWRGVQLVTSDTINGV